ncbi:MAG: RNA polymerase sigma factor [Saprospiraceae bacterium]|nr:RNA polymerase sigma factor [Saprospiraceae bacterium]
MTEFELIERCRQQDAKAQRTLYERYSPKMLGVCRRYISSREDAEDVLVEGMFKVFDNIQAFQSAGSFEGWIRRIIVNEALMFLRKKRLLTVDTDVAELNSLDHATPLSIEHELAAKEILQLLDRLPTGYRTVFNLFVIEGYKHIEIAEMLNISINTSKSQLILAKERMRKELERLEK